MINNDIKGLELSEQYYKKICAPMIAKKFADYKNKIAAGLVGDGSECFGFDDIISRDHDWSASVCLWLNKKDYESIGNDLTIEFNKLPKDFGGFGPRAESSWGSGRTGVFEIGSFYRRFTGLEYVPSNLFEWRLIPENNLSAATNGKVFVDPYGEFTEFRNRLKNFYPEDIRLKKIAARCMKIAQSGQYNYSRCLRRSENVAAHTAISIFINATVSMIFLLNKEYVPFYKWMHRALCKLPILGNTVFHLLDDLVSTSKAGTENRINDKKNQLIEEICSHVINELKKQELSDSSSDFLLDHGPIVQEKIKDSIIRKIDIWLE